MLNDLYDEARNISKDVGTFDFVIKVYRLFKDDKISRVDYVSLCSLAWIWKAAGAKDVELLNYEVEEVLWNIIEHIFPKNKEFSTKLLKLKKSLFPTPSNPKLTMTPEVFSWLQEEARGMLERNKDATDQERKYWSAIAKGQTLPAWAVIEESDVNKNS